MEKYLNPELTPEERAEDLLCKMSLDEKMGQVNCLFPYGDNKDTVAHDMRHGIGQVSTLEVREITSLEKAAAWQRSLQERIMECSEHHIPAIFHMEGLCGAFIQDAASFPSNIGRGSSWNPALEQKIGEIVSRQELACGITQVLAPVLDISRDSRMGRQCESYGEDPALAAAMGTAYTKGVQEGSAAGRKAESAAKHFLGFHNSQGGIHGANCDVPDRLLDEVYGKPFQCAIKEAGLRGVMPCYSSINGEPLSVSKRMLTGLLREEMGFDGICVADYSAVSNVHTTQKIGESLADVGLLSMDAGMDVEMQNCVCFNEELKERFRSGEADMMILDRAVRRVLEAKFRMGLFEHPFALTENELKETFYDEKDKEVSLQSALESLILLKNTGVLPIAKDVRKIAVIGCHADNARAFFGGYTHLSMVEAVHAVANSIAGLESGSMNGKKAAMVAGTQVQSDESEEFDAILKQQKPECKSLLKKLKEVLPEVSICYAYGYPVAGNDITHFPEALEAVQEADLVLMTLGGKNGSCSVATMGEGVDGTNINLPFCQEEFIREAAKYEKPLVGIHFDGRPISSDAADQYLDAILEAWNPSEMGADAIVKVLTGAYNPCGKLPVSAARNAGQIPIYYNHPNGSAYHQGGSIGFKDYVDMPHTPRYFFGHGLSYTEFEYTSLVLSADEIGPDGSVRVTVSVKNTGACGGTEIVQLYIRDVYASMTRPVKELAGFAKVYLDAGEEKKIEFVLNASQTAFLDRNMKWKVEKGEMEVQVGKSSEEICLKDTVMITKDAWIQGRERAFYTIGKVNG
ncbi:MULTISPECIES: glycoside hydrolase family 3 N-terminal domain-containing protein [Blautia]|uniref:glycoside hydrolase family 3 N-terminal domain-containing protein n=1 Tax=Blautia TaxID=572511 RepID=UPI000BA2FDBD|nr:MULTISPECIES: glycoside hydrolase family 3 N-terminal domain-containing protein [Blautia]